MAQIRVVTLTDNDVFRICHAIASVHRKGGLWDSDAVRRLHDSIAILRQPDDPPARDFKYAFELSRVQLWVDKGGRK